MGEETGGTIMLTQEAGKVRLEIREVLSQLGLSMERWEALQAQAETQEKPERLKDQLA